MFKQLAAFLATMNISMTLSMKADIISVTLVPRSKVKDGEPLNTTPLSISGTAEELDANLITEVTKAFGQSVGFMSNAEEFVASAKKVESDVKEEAKKKADDKASGVVKAAQTKAPALTAEQKTAIATGKKNLERAAKEKDADVIEFLRNASVKVYTEAKFDKLTIEKLEQQFEGIVAKKPASDSPDLFSTAPAKEEDVIVPEPPAEDTDEVAEKNDADENAEGDDDVIASEEEDDIF